MTFLTASDINKTSYYQVTQEDELSVRSRLFEQWFHHYLHNEQYQLEVYHSKDGGVDYFYGLIVRRDNPDIENIVKTFKDFLADY